MEDDDVIHVDDAEKSPRKERLKRQKRKTAFEAEENAKAEATGRAAEQGSSLKIERKK